MMCKGSSHRNHQQLLKTTLSLTKILWQFSTTITQFWKKTDMIQGDDNEIITSAKHVPYTVSSVTPFILSAHNLEIYKHSWEFINISDTPIILGNPDSHSRCLDVVLASPCAIMLGDFQFPCLGIWDWETKPNMPVEKVQKWTLLSIGTSLFKPLLWW